MARIRRVIVGMIGLFLLTTGGATVNAKEQQEITLEEDAFVSSFNNQNDQVMIESNDNKIIVGKGRHAFYKLNLKELSSDSLDKVTLNLAKSHAANTLVYNEASNFLRSDDGKEGDEEWTADNITFNKRPINLDNSKKYTHALDKSGEYDISLDVSEIVKKAINENRNVITIHITTEEVEDSTVSATEFYSSRSGKKPYIAISKKTDEQPIEIVGNDIGDYTTNSFLPIGYYKIKDPKNSSHYVSTDGNGNIQFVKDSNQAEVFSIYKSEAVESIKGNIDSTFAIQSTENGKFLTIQLYFNSTDDDKSYYNKLDENNFYLNFSSPRVNYNERFKLTFFEKSNRVTIASHLDTLRDEESKNDFYLSSSEKGLTTSRNQRNPYYFELEESNHSGPIVVTNDVYGDEMIVSWKAVQEDDDISDYKISSGTSIIQEGDYFQSTIPINQLDEENSIVVNYNNENIQVSGQTNFKSFTHPGIQLNNENLQNMKQHIQDKEEPWYSDYLKLRDNVPNQQSSVDYVTNVHEGVGRGDPAGHGNIGDFEKAGNAAYFNALQWVITGEDKFAKTATKILNSWSSELKVIDGRDRILGAGINSVKLIEAAEILAYFDGGYDDFTMENQSQMQRMLKNVVYPVIEDLGSPMIANGNWDTAAMNAMIAIGIFTNDQEIFQRAIDLYQDTHINGSISVYVSDSGQSVESARDQAHAQLGIGYMAATSQAAYNQNIDLFSLYDNRLAKAFEWAAKYNLYEEVSFTPLMNVFQDTKRGYWTILDSEKINRGELRPVYEQVLAHYQNKGVDMTWTEKAARAMRSEGLVHNDNLNFSTLTFYNGEKYESAPSPTFKIRTRLEPWYERNLQFEDDKPVYETLSSYYSLSNNDEISANKQRDNADVFQLIANEDGTYAILNQENGKYLSIKEELNKEGNNLLKADATKITDSEKFNVMGTGVGCMYLESPAFSNRIVTTTVENEKEPENANLVLSLGSNQTDDFASVTLNDRLIFHYLDDEEASILPESIKLNATGIKTLKKGKHIELSPEITPENATSKHIEWAFSREGIVEIDEDNILTAKKPGITKVTAKTVNGKSATVTIRVTK
ncbi:MAG TPA: alginate lyase family protein [Candidatus Tetragenococcus pullicola]|nr:alginate lyase family protein [Candidatus Tetragenococcus pullicola]